MKVDFVLLVFLLLSLGSVAQPASTANLKLPSEMEFDALMSRIGPIASEQRDYEGIAEELYEIMRKYPNSPGASLAVSTLRGWVNEGLVTDSEAQAVYDESAVQGESTAEVGALLDYFQGRTVTSNRQATQENLDSLFQIAERDAGTLSGYLASASLVTIHRQLGNNAAAFEALERFFSSYPMGQNDYVVAESLERDLVFLDAELAALIEGPEEGYLRYEEIATSFAGIKIYDLIALWSAGEVAMEAGLNDEAIAAFEELSRRYAYTDDSRVIVAKFKVAEAYLHKREFQKARDIFASLKLEFRDTGYEKEAGDWLKFVAEVEALDKSGTNVQEADIDGEILAMAKRHSAVELPPAVEAPEHELDTPKIAGSNNTPIAGGQSAMSLSGALNGLPVPKETSHLMPNSATVFIIAVLIVAILVALGWRHKYGK